MFTVVIDPGHGGKDHGASHGGVREKDVVLNIGLKLRDYVKKQLPLVRVVCTREKDIFVPLHRRAAIANENKADLFISLHANSCLVTSVSGVETYVMGLHSSEENLEVAKKENSVILMEEDHTVRYEGFDPGSPESYIMFEMVQDQYLDQSITMATLVQSKARENAGRKNRGVRQAGFLVLRRIGMPGILIETGFLSNAQESSYLNSEEGQTNLARVVYEAIADYYSNLYADRP